MIADRNILHGVVRNGVIIPDKGVFLPDGADVEIHFLNGDAKIPDVLRTEFAAWDKAGTDAWAMIDEWENEDAPKPGADI